MTKLDQLAMMAGQIVDTYLDGDEEVMVSLLHPIEQHAPQHQAATPREALFQLLLAAADAGNLVDSDMDDKSLREKHRRIEGCIISAINVFEQACGLDREQLGGQYFANRRYVPQLWQRDEGESGTATP